MLPLPSAGARKNALFVQAPVRALRVRTLHKLQLRSLTELSGICGRKVPSLSRTLRLMEGYGLVELRGVGARVRPLAFVTTFLVVLD